MGFMEREPRLQTDFWVKAYMRRCQGSGGAAFVVRRGNREAGVVLIKPNHLNGGFAVLARSRDLDGAVIWRRATGPDPVEETAAERYVEQQIKFDPDLWVIEVEDREGRHFLDEPVHAD